MPSGRLLKPVPPSFRGRKVEIRLASRPQPSVRHRSQFATQRQTIERQKQGVSTTYRLRDVVDWAEEWANQIAHDAGRLPPALRYSDALFLAVKYLGDVGLETVCTYCGDAAGTTVDHIVALHVGGDEGWKNVTPACRSCNSSKRDRPITDDWLTRRAQRPRDRAAGTGKP